MSSAKMRLLERQFARANPEKAPAPADDDLAAAIQRLVDQRVEAALEQQPTKQPAAVQRLLDQQFNKPEPMPTQQLPPGKRPREPLSMVFHRSADGRIAWVETSDGVRAELVRDGAGQAIAMREITESPVLPAARKYKDGV